MGSREGHWRNEANTLIFLSLAILATLLGILWQRVMRRRRVLVVVAIVAAGCFLLLAGPFPFADNTSSVLLNLAACVSLAAVIGLILDLAKDPSPAKPRELLILIGLAILVMSVVTPWVVRARYLSDLDWSCDGKIVEIYRSRDHGVPSVAVLNADGSETRMENVTNLLFNHARIGDQVEKSPGEGKGILNGQPIQIVQPPWWSE
jgi:hypothetical protein